MLFYVGFSFHLHHLWDAEICDSVKLNRQGMTDLEEENEEEAGISNASVSGVSDIEDMIEKNALINRTQRKITDFFK